MFQVGYHVPVLWDCVGTYSGYQFVTRDIESACIVRYRIFNSEAVHLPCLGPLLECSGGLMYLGGLTADRQHSSMPLACSLT